MLQVMKRASEQKAFVGLPLEATYLQQIVHHCNAENVAFHHVGSRLPVVAFPQLENCSCTRVFAGKAHFTTINFDAANNVSLSQRELLASARLGIQFHWPTLIFQPLVASSRARAKSDWSRRISASLACRATADVPIPSY